ncbi:MAG TPA: glycosyltransferase family 1 protein [Actinomycetota bacterium]|nr:glycosyltransferase family 1 protein [Actinomycetota bacterium]
MTEYLIRSTPGCYRSGVRAEPVPRPASGDTARVRIAIDARPASDAEPTGVGHYTRRMLSHLPAAMPADELVAWHLLAGGSELPRAQNLTEHVSRIPGVLGPVWRRLELPRLERIVRFDALLATNFLPPPTRSDAVVLVVHDLAFEVMPEAGPEFGERWRRRFDGWLRRSAGVIVPSASAKADLLRRHRLDEGRVHVIPHGADRFEAPAPEEAERVRSRFGIGRPFALFVGGIEPRKNLGALVEAFARVADADRWLVIAGGRTYWAPRGTETLRVQVAALPEDVRRRVVLTGYVSNEEKRALLAGATVLAYPSRYEGFGFPVLEGFSARVPVLTSSAASLPEVAGDAALLVDPNDVDAIGDGLARLFDDTGLRRRLVAAGLERLATFSWDRAAVATAGVLRGATDRSASAR